MGWLILAGIIVAVAAMSKQQATNGQSIPTVPSLPLPPSSSLSPFVGVTDSQWQAFVKNLIHLWSLKQGWQPRKKLLTEVGSSPTSFATSKTEQANVAKKIARLFYTMIQNESTLKSIVGTKRSKFPVNVTMSGVMSIIYSEGLSGAISILVYGRKPLARTEVIFKYMNGLF